MTSRPYLGVPAEQRVEERRERLLDAGLALFGTKGAADTRLDELCAEAGLTKRYFYESFATMADLLDAVFDRAVSELFDVTLKSVATGGWREPRPALEAITRRLVEDPRMLHILLVENSPELLAKRRLLLDLAVDSWLAADPHRSPDPAHLAEQRFLAHAMGGAWAETLSAWMNGRIELSLDELIDQLVRVFERITPRHRYPDR